MTQELIDSGPEFSELCKEIKSAGIVGFDTEFVSESTYRPELCLLQFALPGRCVAVDPFAVPDMSAWWDLMLDDQTVIIVHGGREEIRFCLTYTGEVPRLVRDVQVAEGLRGRGFPLGYEAIVKRVLGLKLHSNETRTDWRRRPLSAAQMKYALEDVDHLLSIWQKQETWLKRNKRLSWAEAEFQRLIDEVAAEKSPNYWLRLSGLTRLSPRELAVAREVYRWREQEGFNKNRPVRKVLRDDLLIDLARRQPKTVEDVLSTRDMNRPEFRKAAPEIVAAILRAKQLPEGELPPKIDDPDAEQSYDEQVLGQLLGIALANRCAELNVAMSLVGKTSDLRHLVRAHVYMDDGGIAPRLREGWRAEVCGDLLTDVLDGKIALRVADPQSDHPLVFERRPD